MVRINVPSEQRGAPLVRPQGPAPRPTRKVLSGTRRYGRLNALTGRLLVLLVILSAIPVASNRPAWWLVWTLLLGLGGVSYMMCAHWLSQGRRPLQITRFRLFLGLALLVPLYAVIQSLPLSVYLPMTLQALPSGLPDVLRPDSLSVMPGASFLGAVRAVGFLVFLILAIEVGTQAERTHRLGLMLLVGIVLHGVFGLVALRLLNDFAIWGDKEVYRGVLTGTFVNRNSMATFLGFGVVLAVAFAMERAHRASLLATDRGYAALLTPQRLEIVGLWLAVALLGLAILLTQSRMGTAATAAGAFVTFITLRLTCRVSLRRTALEGVAGLVVLVAFLIPAVGEGLVERTLFTLVESSDRVSIYIQTWGMILERPLTGFGYDAFAPAYELYRDEPFVADRFADMAHNTYLTLWSEQGLIVGSIPIAMTCWAGGMIVQRLCRNEGDIAVNAAALGAITLGGLHSLVDFSLEIPANVYCFLLILGLAIARPRLPLTGEGPGEAPEEPPTADKAAA